MSAAGDRSDRTVRITVKVRPDEYDKFCRHVRQLGSNLSAFFRESAEKAMREQGRASLEGLSSVQHDADVATILGLAERNTNHGESV
jgi:hypothetical protein